jgi:uncharacterized repeat protein (TIGR04076 family)
MVTDANVKGFLVGALGVSEEDLNKISPDQEEELKNVGMNGPKYKVIAEVLEVKYCSAGLEPGQKYVIGPAQQVNLEETTAPLCLGALAPLGQKLEVFLDRMGRSGKMVTSDLRGYRCTDPGVGLNGLGTVSFKISIEEA